MLQKNVASQKWRVFAFDVTSGVAKTGDAANITAKIAKDWAAAGATNDVNPTETEDGYYNFDLTQAETNADVLDLFPESSTSNIAVIGVPGSMSTVPVAFADNPVSDVPTVAEFEARTIVAADYFDPAADAVANVTLVATTTTNTDMVGTDNAATAANLATVDGKLPAALVSGRMNSNVSALDDESGAAIRMARFFLAGRHGVAQGGTSGSITLAPGAVTDDDFFNGSTVVLSANTARRQYRLITDCTAADDVAVITPDWIIPPDDSTEYVIIPFGFSDTVAISGSVAAADSITEARMAALTDWINGGRLDTLLDAIPTTVMRGTDGANTTTPPTVGAIADAVFDEATAGHVAANSFGKLLADVLGDTNTSIPALIAALNNITAAAVLAAGDADGFSLEESLKILLAAAAGKASGLATPTAIYRAADDSKARITATVDADGNRSAVTLDKTG